MAARATGTDRSDPVPPLLPPGRHLVLAGRGTTWIRELPGPIGGPTVVLLHGWTATADLNFFAVYSALARHARVVALDHRGHGRGIRSRAPFRLEDCADDVVALADELGVERIVPFGYSMGGTIAQLVWRRHPDRVQGLVLCATARGFASSQEEQLTFAGMSALATVARFTPGTFRQWLGSNVLFKRRGITHGEWVQREVERHDLAAVLEAGRALGEFSSGEWLPSVDVPTGVVMTTRDRVVPPRRQLRLAESIPTARLWRVDGDHDVVVAHPERFLAAAVEALAWASTG